MYEIDDSPISCSMITYDLHSRATVKSNARKI